MKQVWKPSLLGRLLTGSRNWKLSITGDFFALSLAGKSEGGSLLDFQRAHVVPGSIWASVTLQLIDGRLILLDGLGTASAREMARSVETAIRQARVSNLLANFDETIAPVVRWATKVQEACWEMLALKGWLAEEFKAAVISRKPVGLEGCLAEPEVIQHLDAQAPSIRHAVAFWRKDFHRFADELNEQHLVSELRNSKAFFDQVEKSPLTEEQARAVICFDNRVLLVAAAGSGKTSTMVAKAGYALKKGYFQAEHILLLAFNAAAATELGERIKTRLEPLGLAGEKVKAKTFHAFGLEIIGEATGKRPTVAPWLESGRDVEFLLGLIDDLKDRDPKFRSRWDLFRVVLGQDLPKFGKEQDAPDSWDRERKTEGFWTLAGEVVKSRGEQIIANWLFYNGVSYRYEAPYAIETADAYHRQYYPDFYLPDVDAYLEHWAVDEEGNPPPEFKGYKDSMAWKRQLHAENGTRLLETTMAGLWSGEAFTYLAEQLTTLGITLDPNPDRPCKGRRPIENPRLARTFRTFLIHAKSNRLDLAALSERLEMGDAGRFQFRHRMFLDLFQRVWDEWERRLRAEGFVDFEDMLNLAADCVESGQWKSPYELVMIDEFQDVSRARARLVAGLLDAPEKYLFAVGDDWQSINRFAGSDLAVMSEFDARFGKATTLKLETTFRCPQSLCDISSAFVQRNPAQFRKKVRSAKPDVKDPIRLIRVPDESKIQSAILKRVRGLADEYAVNGRRPKIYVLGRYRKEQELVAIAKADERVDLEFVTVHASKGLEADHVIVPKVVSGNLGFPSRVEDDPVLHLAMPGADTFEDAEERRLFYVALTRARLSVTLITVDHEESSFVTELIRDFQLEVCDEDGESASVRVCPKCAEGLLVQRRGEYGPFYGCSRFPRCRHTEKISSNPALF